jgi:hypothetical protein
MTFGMSGEHTSYQMRTVNDQVARCRGRSVRQDAANGISRSGSRGRGYLPRLRSLVGFTLVEAGLRLLPPEGSHQHG